MNVIIHYYVVDDHPSPIRMQEFAAVRQRLHYHAASCGVPVIEYKEDRPTFDTLMRRNALPHDINVCLNSDCYFLAEDLYKLRHIKEREAFCLSRWEVQSADDAGETAAIMKTSGAGSQDAWVFVGRLESPANLDFSLGSRGCDNRIASIFLQAGYKLRNPAKSIRLMHYHASGIRKWLPRVPGAYKQVPITTF
jgi:hypothetical protein